MNYRDYYYSTNANNYNYSPSGFPPATKTILIINIVVYILQNYFPFGGYLTYFGGVSAAGVIQNFYFWQPVTYMFLHGSFMHIFFNMFIFIMLGKELEILWGTRDFLKYYFFTGIGAGICIVLLGISDMSYIPTIGASGSIMGLLVAYGLMYPDRRILAFFIIPMKMRTFIMVTIGISLYYILSGTSSGISHIGHLGGIISGIVYYIIFKNNHNFAPGYYNIERLIIYFKNKFHTGSGGNHFGYYNDYDNNKTYDYKEKQEDIDEEKKLDEILDKIRKKGLNSITLEERLFLDKVSKKYKDKF